MQRTTPIIILFLALELCSGYLPRGPLRITGTGTQFPFSRRTHQPLQTHAETIDISSPPSKEPTTAQILKFCLPTLAIWLSSPVLSLIDTSVVGLKSSVELAALSPSVQLCDSSLYMFNFLAVATTNLLAQSGGDHSEETEGIVARAFTVALASGIGLFLFIQLFGPRILHNMAGKHAPEIVAPAIRFARVRIFGSPFTMVDAIGKAACLGYRDVRTPLISTIAASICNAMGDWYFVFVANLGIFGAGLATAASEVVSSAILFSSILHKNKTFRKRFSTTSKPSQALQSMFLLPSMVQLKAFWTFAGPICLAMIGKTVSYSAMTLFATSCGVIPLAAHQVMLRFFFFFTCFGESLSQTVQTFLPALIAEGRRAAPEKQDIPLSVTNLIQKIVLTAVVVGQLLSGVAYLAPIHLPALFSNDRLVWSQMRHIGPFLGSALRFHVIAMVLEGSLLALRDLSFLAKTYFVNTFLTFASLYFINHWQTKITIRGVWVVVFGFQLIRVMEFGARLLQLLVLDKRKYHQLVKNEE